MRVAFEHPPSTSDLARFGSRLEKRYPTPETLLEWSAQLQTPASTQPTPRAVGLLLRSTDQRYVVQARQDGLRLSSLAPYEGWQSFLDEARFVWGEYGKTLQPRRVTGLSVRYINRIPIEGTFALEDYLLSRPEVAPGLSKHVSDLFLRLVLEVRPGTTMAITQYLERAVDQALILDLEASRRTDAAPEEPAIWTDLEELRQTKNRYFFASVTDRVVQLSGGFA